MDKSFRRHESGTQKPGSFFVNPLIFENILRWLARLFQLTEEEQNEAGIYLDDQYPR
jgi:hypothetical protein